MRFQTIPTSVDVWGETCSVRCIL